ncbi:predicted protein [Nematostella vectensis]|uniref:G-protein coupled receptors family 1 profile domain-containing protein n=1 Tax=Nematostella vectensis TaxID=45351 RepID=A7RPM7_NEMVE|nr:predicted protein [Nematostella vectensis]|eukprot:XP_001638599.1 predicted protein [Nematostella vectensis]
MAIIIFFATTGNILILLAIYMDRTLRTMTNVFVVNLACADLLLALIGMPFTLVSSITFQWVFGDVWCVINGMAVTLFCVASMLTLAAVSIDRYIAIIHPLKYTELMHSRTATGIIVYIWAHSFIVALLPVFRWSRYIYIRSESICTFDWAFDIACTLFIFVVCFFIPLSVMMFTYYRKSQQRTEQRFKQDNKAVRTLLIVVGTFILCWLPHFIGIFCLMSGTCAWPDRYFAITTWLAMLNSACNPVIYGAMSRQFRKRFKQILQCKRSFF